MTATDTYWTACRTTMDLVRTAQPMTAVSVVAILNDHDPMGRSAGDAFWSASGLDDGCLLGLLLDAGWRVCWSESDDHWCVHRPLSGDHLGYVEGDVFARELPRPY